MELKPSQKCNGNKSYVKVRIFDNYMYALADTGSNLSLICANLLPQHVFSQLSEYTGKVVGAEGSPLHIEGILEINIQVADKQLKLKALVVNNLQEDLLLGVDFCVENNVILNFSNLTCQINDLTVPLMRVKDKKVAYKACLSKTIHIPARSVANNIACKIRCAKSKSNKYSTFSAVFDPCDKLLHKKYQVESETGLINVTKGKSYITLINNNDFPIQIYRNQTLGRVECITNISVNVTAEESEVEFNIDNMSQDEKDELLFEKLDLKSLTHLSSEQMRQVKQLIIKHRDVFALTEDFLPAAKLAPHKIVLDTQVPIRAPFRPIPMKLRPHAEKLCNKLMSLGIIEPSNSPYHSPAFIQVKRHAKGGNAKYRLISDLRLVNSHVQRSYQPLPDIESLTTMWEGCKYFSKMDLSMGYWQQPLHEDSKPVTACSIPSVCTFQYARVPLGLTSSPGSFQQEIEKVMLGLKNTKCAQYLDDLASAARKFLDALNKIDKIFTRLRSVNLKLKPEKTRLFMLKISFLGFILSHKGLEMDSQKCDGLLKMSRPRNKKQIKSFVSMAGFYRKFLKDFALICKPMTNLLKQNVKFVWNKEQDDAFQAIKDKIAENVVLKFPDLNKEFVLKTDASDYSIGAVLSQMGDDGFLHPVAFASNLLTPTQQRWSTFQKELYSMKVYCEKYRVLLLNQSFTIHVDHKPLLHWRNSKLMQGPLWRWFHDLAQFQFQVKYIEGPKNIADCLSRLPRTDDELYNSYIDHNNETEVSHKGETLENDKHPNVISPSNNVTSETCVNSSEISMNESVVMVLTTTESTERNANPVVKFIDNSALASAQNHDPVLSVVKSWVKSNKKPDLKDNKTQKLNPDLKTYRDSFDRLKIENNILYRSWEKQSDEQPDWLICLPEYYHETAIKLAHDIPSSGHMGKFKTLERLRKSVYFPKCELQVSLYIDSCKQCILKSRKPKLKAPLTPFHGTCPNDIVQFDLMGPFPKSVEGYTMVLIIIDKFTAWAEAVPLKETSTGPIARSLLDVWISRNGLFSQCHSDNGPSFTSAVMKIVMKLMGDVYHSHTCPFTPKSNGGAEAMVRIVKDLLKAYCSDQGNKWPDMLQQCMFAYRSSISVVSGYSPHFLHTGQKPRVCLDLLFNTYEPKRFESHGEYAYDLFKKMSKVHRLVESKLQTNRDFVKTRYDNRVNVVPFEPGQYVYVWRPKYYDKSKNPFRPSFYGPFKIIKKVTDFTYKIDTGSSRIKNIVPHDLLRLAPNGEFENVTDFDADFIDDSNDNTDVPQRTEITDIEEDQDTRPVIQLALNDNVNIGRPVRIRRPPDRYQAGFN